MTTLERLTEIAERAERATAPPWHQANGVPEAIVKAPGGAIYGRNLICEATEPDAAFIAHAREDVPTLCKLAREQDAALAKCVEQLRLVKGWLLEPDRNNAPTFYSHEIIDALAAASRVDGAGILGGEQP